MDGWNTSFLLGWSIFRCKLAVNFSGKVFEVTTTSLEIATFNSRFGHSLAWTRKLSLGSLGQIIHPLTPAKLTENVMTKNDASQHIYTFKKGRSPQEVGI